MSSKMTWKAFKEKTRQGVGKAIPGRKFEATKLERSEALFKDLSAKFQPHIKELKGKVEALESARTGFLAASVKTLQCPLPGNAGGEFRPDQEGRDGSGGVDAKVLSPLNAWLADYAKAKQQLAVVRNVGLELDSYRHAVAELHVKLGKQKAKAVRNTTANKNDLAQAEETLARKEQKATDRQRTFETEEEAVFQQLTFLVQGAASLKAGLAEYTRAQVQLHERSDAYLGHMAPSPPPASSLASPTSAQSPSGTSDTSGAAWSSPPQSRPASAPAPAPAAKEEPEAPSSQGGAAPAVPPPAKKAPSYDAAPQTAAAPASAGSASAGPNRSGRVFPAAPQGPRAQPLAEGVDAPRSGSNHSERELATNPFLARENRPASNGPTQAPPSGAAEQGPKDPGHPANWPVIEAV